MGRRWRRLGGGALALLVVVAVAEAILRWGVGLGDPPLARLDPDTEYELVRSAEYRRWGNTISINALGMRAPDPPAPSRPSDRRVLVIGDSVVYGGHRLDQSETVAARMTAALETDPALAGCRPIVLPMAVSSWGPINQAAFLARDGLHGADVAALVISAHDLAEVPDGREASVPYGLSSPGWAIGDAVHLLRQRLSSPEPGPPLAPLEERWAANLAALNEMADRLAAAGVTLEVVYHPTTLELAGTMPPERALVLDWAAGRGLEVVDRIVSGPGPSGYRDLIHPNAAGSDDLARELAAVVSPHLASCSAG